MLPAKTVFEVPEKMKITWSKVGAWSKTSQLKDSINSRVIQGERHCFIWLVKLAAVPFGLGSNRGEGMDVCKRIVPLWHGDTLNSYRATSSIMSCQVIYSQFGLEIHQNDHQARRRFVECAQNEIAVVPDFHKRILFSDEAHFWFNGYVNKQNCRIRSEANPQVYVETPLHPEKLTVWCVLWSGGILLQKR
ncbi:DUF4817 domain-containing protein [Trichonephila clavipes]|nr:DUF4817 domain-containing protein [Trichonephila clavipes]